MAISKHADLQSCAGPRLAQRRFQYYQARLATKVHHEWIPASNQYTLPCSEFPHPPAKLCKPLLEVLCAASLHLRHCLFNARQIEPARTHRTNNTSFVPQRCRCTRGGLSSGRRCRYCCRCVPKRSSWIAIWILLQNVQLTREERLLRFRRSGYGVDIGGLGVSDGERVNTHLWLPLGIGYHSDPQILQLFLPVVPFVSLSCSS